MLILAVDTSTRYRSMALLQDQEVLVAVSDTEQSPYSERLFRDLRSLQELYPFQVRDVDLFAVASGPGSFTGLRVGLTAVKGWAEVYGKPIASVSALDAIAAQSAATGRLAAYFDARRGQVFGAVYEWDGAKVLKRLGDEVLLPAEEFLAGVTRLVGGEAFTFVSPAPEVIPAELLAARFPDAGVEKISPALAATIGSLGFVRSARGELVDALMLDANYVRRSDAEVSAKTALK